MTEVKIHGYLSKIFGSSSIKLHLGKLNNLISALDSIKKGFKQKLLQLSSKGMHYCIKQYNNIIHIIPFLGGSGKVLRIVLIVVLVIAAVVLAAFGQWDLAFLALNMAITLLMYKDPKLPTFNTGKQLTGGSVAQATNRSSSYIFSNQNNLASQGSLVNIGYGKVLIGSRIVNISLKNFSTSDSFFSENNFTNSESSSYSILE